jgi:outer membrane protein
VDEARAGQREARAAFVPRVSVSESWQRGDQPGFVFSSRLAARQFAASNFAIDALNHPDPVGFFRTSVGVDQTLFDGGRRRASATAAGLGVEIANAGADDTAAGLAVSVTEAYGRVLVAQATEQAATAGLEAAREDRDRAGRRRDAGLATDADVLSLAVHEADLQERAIRARGDLSVARAHLNHLMGNALDRAFSVAEPAEPPSTAGATLDTLYAEADRQRPDLRRASSAVRAADAGVTGARASLWPQVVAQAAVDVSGTRVTDRASSWLVGGELRWTFSLGGAELARRAAAAAAARRARSERETLTSGVHLDVLTATRRLESAEARRRVGVAAVEQAREGQRIIRNRFEAGVAGVTDVLQASTAVLDAEARAIAARVDVMVGHSLLRRALGRNP